MKKRIQIIVILLLGVIVQQLWAGKTQIKMEDFIEDNIQVTGFKLFKASKIHIEAVGAGEKSSRIRIKSNFQDKNGMIAYAWILDANTRKLVWVMTNQNTDRLGRGYNRKFDDDISLPAGEYEVYFSTLKSNLFFKHGVFSFGDFLDYIFDGDNWWQKGLNEWYISIENVDEILNESTISKIQANFKKNAVVSLNEIGNAEYREFEFQVKKKSDFTIYSIGEGYDGEMFDYSWIINADTREKTWEMREWHTDYAGGAVKNRMVYKDISLDEGQYTLVYVTDGSHSVEKWNSNPPYDPNFWGVTLIAKNKDAKDNVKIVKRKKSDAFLVFNRVGNREFICKPFKIKETTSIIVEALGEGRSGKMFDYGWIEDDDNNVIWEMKYYKTQHAGGSSKNRMIRETIELDKGVYNLCYKSDDSHSYSRWNSDKPYRPEAWGIALYLRDKSKVEIADEKDMKSFSKWQYQITRIGDDEHRFREFNLDKLSKIKIYAIGEGDEDEMFDYAWIESKNNGEIVWKMLARNTDWAGGAEKNRKIKTELYLPPGRYLLHYRSDGSHSFEDWNDDPPKDFRNYGVSIKIEKAN